MADSASWFVKTEDGRVYGPANADKLLNWAKDGRIEPTSFVSSDGKDWKPAPYLKALQMNWIVETELGHLYGPFHREVVSRLINDHVIPKDARMYRLYDGEQEQGAVTVVKQAPSPLPIVSSAPRKGGIFAGASSKQLSVLESAAQRELRAARQKGLNLTIFGR